MIAHVSDRERERELCVRSTKEYERFQRGEKKKMYIKKSVS